MNLQLFAQERTEKATPRRRQKARERGQVFSSRELNSALVLLTAFLSLRIIGKIQLLILLIFNYILADLINQEDIFSPEGIEIFLFEILLFAASFTHCVSSICCLFDFQLYAGWFCVKLRTYFTQT